MVAYISNANAPAKTTPSMAKLFLNNALLQTTSGETSKPVFKSAVAISGAMAAYPRPRVALLGDGARRYLPVENAGLCATSVVSRLSCGGSSTRTTHHDDCRWCAREQAGFVGALNG